MQEISLYDLLRYYAKNWLILLSAVFIGAIIGLVYTNFVQIPLYKSDATLIIINTEPTDTAKDTTLINNYLELLKSRRVLDPVISKLKLHQTYEQLSSSVTTSNSKDTEVIKLSISSKNARSATLTVNSTIESFMGQVKLLYNRDNVQVVDSASTESTPYNVHKNLQLALSTVVGLLSSVIVIFFIYDFKLSNGTLDAKQKQNKPAAKVNKAVSGPARVENGRFVKKKLATRERINSWLPHGHSKKAAKKVTKKK